MLVERVESSDRRGERFSRDRCELVEELVGCAPTLRELVELRRDSIESLEDELFGLHGGPHAASFPAISIL